MQEISYKTDIKKAIGLGNSRSGVSHWKWQRISAIALAPMYLWFIYRLVGFFISSDSVIEDLLYSPLQLLFFIILINVSIYHGALGIKVICEDYIHHEFTKIVAILFCYFLSFVTMCGVTFALMLNFIVNI